MFIWRSGFLLMYKICNISIRDFATCTWYLNDIECKVELTKESIRLEWHRYPVQHSLNVIICYWILFFFNSKASDANIAHFVYFVKTPIATVENYLYSMLTPVFPESLHAWLFLNLVILVTFNLGLKYCHRESQYPVADVCRPGGFNVETTTTSVLHF